MKDHRKRTAGSGWMVRLVVCLLSAIEGVRNILYAHLRQKLSELDYQGSCASDSCPACTAIHDLSFEAATPPLEACKCHKKILPWWRVDKCQGENQKYIRPEIASETSVDGGQSTQHRPPMPWLKRWITLGAIVYILPLPMWYLTTISMPVPMWLILVSQSWLSMSATVIAFVGWFCRCGDSSYISHNSIY